MNTIHTITAAEVLAEYCAQFNPPNYVTSRLDQAHSRIVTQLAEESNLCGNTIEDGVNLFLEYAREFDVTAATLTEAVMIVGWGTQAGYFDTVLCELARVVRTVKALDYDKKAS
jgi:hypothetical protein